MTTSPREMVEGLLWKYSELVELLETRLAMQATGASCFPEDQGRLRRVRMHALASRFPGALRELERATLAGLKRRHDVLRAIAEGRAHLEEHRWVETVWRYHAALRALLRSKRTNPDAPRGRPSHMAVDQVALEMGLDRDTISAEIEGVNAHDGGIPSRE